MVVVLEHGAPRSGGCRVLWSSGGSARLGMCSDVASRRLCNASDGATESDAPRRRDLVRVGRGSVNNGVSAQAVAAPFHEELSPRVALTAEPQRLLQCSCSAA